VRFFTLFILIYGIYLGFAEPENRFTTAIFWSLFWSFFMTITLPTFGRVFCMVCPHGFAGKYISKIGLNKTLPKSLQNPFIGLGLIFIAYWIPVYLFPKFYKDSFNTAVLFGVLTIFAFLIFYIYKNMSYCKYFCPIGAINRAFAKVSFTFLSTEKTSCATCKTFECAKSCSWNLNPSNFEKNNSMNDCTLCMDCANSCEAVQFEVKKPSHSLLSPMKKAYSFEIWTYILAIGVISYTMQFHHGLGHSAIGNELPWAIIGNEIKAFFEGIITFKIDYTGGVALAFGLFSAIFLSTFGLFLASKSLKQSYKETFLNLGYALAPLMIVGSLSHSVEFFFLHYYSNLMNSISDILNLNIIFEPLANRRLDPWLKFFTLFKLLAVILAFYILYARLKFVESSFFRKFLAFIFASLPMFFYIFASVFTIYVFITYGAMRHS
jgi:ferredoxin